MSNGAWVKVGSSWQDVNQVGGVNRPYVKVGSSWIGTSQLWHKRGSVWYQIYEYDNTAPSVASFTITALQNGDMRATWGAITDGESGVATVKLTGSYFDGALGYLNLDHTIPSSQYGGGSYDYTVPTSIRKTQSDTKNYTMYFRITMTDNAGNEGSTTTNFAATKPYGWWDFDPTDSGTYKFSYPAGFRTDNEDVFGGYFSSNFGNQRGFYYHGTALQSACGGFEPDQVWLTIERDGTSGSAGGDWRVAPHGYSTQGTSEQWVDTTKYKDVYVANVSNANVHFQAPSTWHTQIGNGQIRSFGTPINQPQNYIRLKAWNESPASSSNYRSGHIRLYFS